MFPGARIPVADIIAEGDKVAIRYTFTGVHIGLGREIVQTGITIDRFADGQIVESWWAWDILGLMQQITPPTAGQ